MRKLECFKLPVLFSLVALSLGLMGCALERNNEAIDVSNTKAIEKAEESNENYVLVDDDYFNISDIKVDVNDLYARSLLLQFGDGSLYMASYDSVFQIDGGDFTGGSELDIFSNYNNLALNGSYVKLSSGSIYSTAFARDIKWYNTSYKNRTYCIVFMKLWSDSPTKAELEEFTKVN